MWKENVRYKPEKYNLTYLTEIDLEEPHYSFEIVGVWKHENGTYYIGTDGGCSCPSPFEYYNGIEDLTGPLTAEEAKEEITSLWKQAGKYDPQSFQTEIKKIV
jgi:hypothetical protein